MYPKYKDKHLEEALWHPKENMDKSKLPKDLPKKFVLIYYVEPLKYFKKKYKFKKIKILKNSFYEAYQYKDIGLIKIKGVGSPQAAAVIDELIALGGKLFLNIGSAGGLSDKGIYLCIKALRDEGTSYHYLPHGHFTFPDEELTEKLGEAITNKKLEFKRGINWTIDAPYRETKKEIEHYRKKGISTVEMEASALFAVAKYRDVKIASAFVVSDTLVEKREVHLDKKEFKQKLNKLLDAAIDCLINLKA